MSDRLVVSFLAPLSGTKRKTDDISALHFEKYIFHHGLTNLLANKIVSKRIHPTFNNLSVTPQGLEAGRT